MAVYSSIIYNSRVSFLLNGGNMNWTLITFYPRNLPLQWPYGFSLLRVSPLSPSPSFDHPSLQSLSPSTRTKPSPPPLRLDNFGAGENADHSRVREVEPLLLQGMLEVNRLENPEIRIDSQGTWRLRHDQMAPFELFPYRIGVDCFRRRY